jgi:hypothetical protein
LALTSSGQLIFNQTFSYFCFNRQPDFFRLFFQFIHLKVFLVQTERLFTGVSMKKLVCPFAVGLSAALLVGQLSAQAQILLENWLCACRNESQAHGIV